MNKIILLLAAFLGLAVLARAQTPDTRTMQVRHALFIHAGGAEVGVGPGYELQLSKPNGFTLGCALGLPLVHSTWHKYYSPISLSPAINLMYGRRAWKMEFATEYNYFLEWGHNVVGDFVPYALHTLAWMGGVRRQVPWGGFIFRANLGVKMYALGHHPEPLPAATLSVGYLLGKKNAPENPMPPKPMWKFGHRLGPTYSGGRKTFQIQVAPVVSAGIIRVWEHSQPNFWNRSADDFRFRTSWAAQAGMVADLGNSNAIAGVRFGVMVGLQQVRMDWTRKTIFSYENGFHFGYTEFVHFNDLQLAIACSASLRLRTRQVQPWIFQVGMYRETTRNLVRDSWLDYDYSNARRILPKNLKNGLGPSVTISKQFSLGIHAIEPFVSGRCSIHRIYSVPSLYNWGTGAGVMIWL